MTCPPPGQALLFSAASFIHHNYITEVERMLLENIKEVVNVSSLADVNVTDCVYITNVSGNIAPILSRIKCKCLCISKMMLSTEDTAALVQGMQTSLERVRLGDDLVELDMDTLLTYNGRGHCRMVQCRGETRRRYGDQLATWGETMGWGVEKDINFVNIYRL